MYNYRWGDEYHFDKNGGFGGSLFDRDMDEIEDYIRIARPYLQEGMVPEDIDVLMSSVLSNNNAVKGYHSGLWSFEEDGEYLVKLVLCEKVGEFDPEEQEGSGYIDLKEVGYVFATVQDRDDFLRSFMM
jgi:hypothetical protein|nr:MAG TPA: hypothetical protein [Caudoviricetes sp.]